MFATQTDFNVVFSKALAAGHIVPHYQPILNLRELDLVGFEVLARWNDPRYANISPAKFIEFAERGGLLDKLLETLLHSALAHARTWPEKLFLAFNVSPSQLVAPQLLQQLEHACCLFGFSPARLEIEITETALIAETDVALGILRALNEMGCRVVLDDFGTGFSSLTWLRTLPFSKIKIDSSFIATVQEQRESRKIVAAIIGLGQSLGLPVVAEGVETSEQLDLLRDMGSSHAQGYLFSRAIPSEEIAPFLTESAFRRDLKAVRSKLSLEQRAHQIAALYNSDNMSIGFLSPNHVVLDASPTFASRLNRTMSDVIGQKLADLVAASEGRTEWLKTYRLKGIPYPAFAIRLDSGRTSTVLIHRVLDEIGDLLGYSVVGIDITSLKETEAALDEAKAKNFTLRG